MAHYDLFKQELPHCTKTMVLKWNIVTIDLYQVYRKGTGESDPSIT